MPDQSLLESAHAHSIRHRAEVLASWQCGCFHCAAVFAPSEIEEWIDTKRGHGQTALCPRCGIDAVLGEQAGFPLTADFLIAMYRYWFERTVFVPTQSKPPAS